MHGTRARRPGLTQQPPLTPEYQAIFEASLKDQAAGGRGNSYQSSCVLDGMPRLMNLTAPMEILIQPGLTFFIFQDAFARRIHTDGAAMPESEAPSFQGYSTGKWIDADRDGRYDAFEVETRNFKGPRALDATGLPLHKDNQTVVKERLSLDKGNKDLLRNEITTIDNAFTRPWTVTKTYVRERNPRWTEYHCAAPGTVFTVSRISPQPRRQADAALRRAAAAGPAAARRPARGDGSSRHQQIYGAGLLHRRSVRLEFAQARARPHRRRRAGAAERIAPGGARLFLREQHEDLGPRAGEAPARVHHGDGRQVPDQHDSAPTPTSCSPSRATSCATARPRC